MLFANNIFKSAASNTIFVGKIGHFYPKKCQHEFGLFEHPLFHVSKANKLSVKWRLSRQNRCLKVRYRTLQENSRELLVLPLRSPVLGFHIFRSSKKSLASMRIECRLSHQNRLAIFYKELGGGRGLKTSHHNLSCLEPAKNRVKENCSPPSFFFINIVLFKSATFYHILKMVTIRKAYHSIYKMAIFMNRYYMMQRAVISTMISNTPVNQNLSSGVTAGWLADCQRAIRWQLSRL